MGKEKANQWASCACLPLLLQVRGHSVQVLKAKPLAPTRNYKWGKFLSVYVTTELTASKKEQIRERNVGQQVAKTSVSNNTEHVQRIKLTY